MIDSKNSLLRHLAAAVRNNDRDEFCSQSAMGIAFFDKEAVASILNRELPLVLDIKYIPRLLKFMSGDEDYVDVVRSLLAELTQVMATSGLTIGLDFSYGENNGIPYIAMTSDAALSVENSYEPHSWKQCLPYISINSGEQVVTYHTVELTNLEISTILYCLDGCVSEAENNANNLGLDSDIPSEIHEIYRKLETAYIHP